MAGVGPGRSATSRRTRVKGQRRSPTWEISDSDFEGDATAEAGAGAQSAAGKRRAASEARRPEQALQRLVVRVDPAVLEDPGSDILMEALSALGCECRIELQSPARSLQWSGLKPDPQAPSVLPEVWATEDQELLLLLEPEEFLQGVTQLTQVLAFLCMGHRSHQLSAQRPQQPVCPEVAQTQMTIGWPEVEEALVLLQLLRNMDVLLVASWQELSRHVCSFTKALAQRPSKQYRDSQAFSFCTGGRWASGQKVARDGSGLQGVWWRQIQQFNRVSPAVADAVVGAFPSPRLLQQALLDCSTDQERLGLLADLPVKAHKGRQHRRVGPDLSRRICLFLTTTNPDLLLDLGS
ncbi:Putative crossover junction endonuclease EME2 [Fukomys damarensis]|uniref:Structure-specific endonuclease subunit EME2 n=1 Tax=Fukomys damarensis TaxID=885580 RepID=A0A091DWU1_FUKDA|nr:Putative crossover junction endonuclease EME2 [Fukomys damarensis]